jgi:uncharacterized protein (TIGR02145 family)
MKKHDRLSGYTLIIFLFLFLSSCAKKDSSSNQNTGSTPVVSTSAVSNITDVTATSGGNVTSQGSTAVTQKGVCWSTSQLPTISNAHTLEGAGAGNFVSSLSALTEKTTYFIRAYATNSAGTAYGNEIEFTTQDFIPQNPTVITNEATYIEDFCAMLSGNVTDEGSAYVMERGLCWSASPNPTTSNIKIPLGQGLGYFYQQVCDFKPGKKYYVRAYAQNVWGLFYGNQIEFTTTGGNACKGVLTVVYEGRTYNTVGIGNQCWFKENLNVGTKIELQEDQNSSNGIIEKYCYNGDENNCNIYGGLYQWDEMLHGAAGGNQICPSGWHVPSRDDWNVLRQYYNTSHMGGYMKSSGTLQAGTGLWESPNTGAFSSGNDGFQALPAGLRVNSANNPIFDKLGERTYIWLNYEHSIIILEYNSSQATYFQNIGGAPGFSVRCIKD